MKKSERCSECARSEFSANDLRVKCMNFDRTGLHWAQLAVIPSERALWRRLDEEMGSLRWRMVFSEMGDEMICSLSHVDEGSVITRQGFAPKGTDAGLSMFLAAVRAAQMFGVGAELLTLPRISVGLRPTDVAGHTVKDCFHVSSVETDADGVMTMEISDQYRRVRWPVARKEETKAEPVVTKRRKAAPAKCRSRDTVTLKSIEACHSTDDLRRLFEQKPGMVNDTAVFAAIKTKFNLLNSL